MLDEITRRAQAKEMTRNFYLLHGATIGSATGYRRNKLEFNPISWHVAPLTSGLHIRIDFITYCNT
jgi:hypothetical protein